MKFRNTIKYLFVPVILIFLLNLWGCKKNEDMVGTIKVAYSGAQDTYVNDAKVVLSQDDIKIVGYTNPEGEYSFTFRLKMKLNVVVTKDTSTVTSSPELRGEGKIALGEHGVNYEEVIYLSQ